MPLWFIGFASVNHLGFVEKNSTISVKPISDIKTRRTATSHSKSMIFRSSRTGSPFAARTRGTLQETPSRYLPRNLFASKSILIAEPIVLLQWALDNALPRTGYIPSTRNLPVDVHGRVMPNKYTTKCCPAGQIMPNPWPWCVVEVNTMVVSVHKYTCLRRSTVRASCIMWENSRACGVRIDAFWYPGFGNASGECTGFDVERVNDRSHDMRGSLDTRLSEWLELFVDGVSVKVLLALVVIKLGDYGYFTDSRDFCCEGNIFTDFKCLPSELFITPGRHKISAKYLDCRF
ncbi:hypothetical protein V8B97DRAFT_557887 [Scleroderma yunnanense]